MRHSSHTTYFLFEGEHLARRPNTAREQIPKGWHEAIPDQGVIAATYVGQVPKEFALELEKMSASRGAWPGAVLAVFRAFSALLVVFWGV